MTDPDDTLKREKLPASDDTLAKWRARDIGPMDPHGGASAFDPRPSEDRQRRISLAWEAEQAKRDPCVDQGTAFDRALPWLAFGLVLVLAAVVVVCLLRFEGWL